MSFLIKYGKYILAATVIAGVLYVAYDAGVTAEYTRHQATILEYKNEIITLKDEQIKEQNILLSKYNDASKAFEIDMSNLKTKEKIFNKEILKEIKIPVYSECRITDNAFAKMNSRIDEVNGVKK